MLYIFTHCFVNLHTLEFSKCLKKSVEASQTLEFLVNADLLTSPDPVVVGPSSCCTISR